jgi:hypothetical protein
MAVLPLDCEHRARSDHRRDGGADVLAGLLFFMFFLDRILHRLRPVAVVALVARAGRQAFEAGATTLEAFADEPERVGLEPVGRFAASAPA